MLGLSARSATRTTDTSYGKLVEAARNLAGGRALVLACGTGRNALFLASKGFDVVAVDVSSVAIGLASDESARRELHVEWRIGDVGEFDFAPAAYDLITMIRYTNRSIWPRLSASLAEGGWLVMEQHLKTYRDVIGPSGDYRLAPGELLGVFPEMRVIRYFEQFDEPEPGRASATVGLLACKGDPGW
jgi:SAM-dependent methyltransferase